eukprot:CAMPEP_0183371146 /NCGR_PEP_ID=MMETSP0164_2-20130417/104492_1 /TAXON_ID=221442 /ORGANISM="Coccolithus pelagicus ssp braarudi, Strain PLY182g" /LENGTH=48 /DNA_ID= /DNA_START= /DNA_END= /DNA_ORIENTATION=
MDLGLQWVSHVSALRSGHAAANPQNVGLLVLNRSWHALLLESFIMESP